MLYMLYVIFDRVDLLAVMIMLAYDYSLLFIFIIYTWPVSVT